MKAITELQRLGYHLTAAGETIKYTAPAGGPSDPDRVRALLAEVKEHKAEALAYLLHSAGTPTPPDDDPGLLDALAAEAERLEIEDAGADVPPFAPVLAPRPRRITGIYTADQVRGLPGDLLAIQVAPDAPGRYLCTWLEAGRGQAP